MVWLILAPLSIIFTLLAMLLAPVLALFVKQNDKLPNWLSWFDTPDNPTIGDAAFHQNQMSWTTNKYLYALFWLWRNPAYGFDFVGGAKIKPGFCHLYSGNDETNNTPLHEGWVYRTVINSDGSSYWQILAIYKLGFSKCIKINLGWKLGYGNNPTDIANAKAKGLDPEIVVVKMRAGEIRQLVCTINPFTKFT